MGQLIPIYMPLIGTTFSVTLVKSGIFRNYRRKKTILEYHSAGQQAMYEPEKFKRYVYY